MPFYRLWPTGEKIEIKDLKEFNIPFSGSRIILKERPPIAKEVSTD